MSDKGGAANKKKGKPPAARKRKAPPVPVEDDTGIDWKEAYESGDLTKFKNAELKIKLKSLGESGAGSKPVMVERLMTALKAVYGSAVSPSSKKAKATEEEDDDDHGDDDHDNDDHDDEEGDEEDDDDDDDE
jgi:hypothetical protein